MTQGPEFECRLEQVLNSRGMSQQQHTQDDAGSTHLMGSHLTGLIPQNDTNIRNHNNYNTDVNMYDEEGHDDAFMDEYHVTRFEPSFSMQDHHHQPPQFSNLQYYGHHPRQYAPSDFGGRGHGVRSQYWGHARPYDFNGYYGWGNEGFAGYGTHRVGQGHSETGDEERLTEGGVLHRQHPSEGRGFWNVFNGGGELMVRRMLVFCGT